MAYLKKAAGIDSYNIVFLDPPYADELIKPALEALIAGNMLRDGAIVIAESDNEEPITAEGLTVLRHYRYSKIYITVSEYKGASAE